MKNMISKLTASLFVAVLALTCSAPSMHAQGATVRVRVAVPFAFEVGPDHFAAGVYEMNLVNSHTLAVRSGANSAFAMILSDSGNSANAKGKVTFAKIGDQYFLRGVFPQGESSNLKCVRTAAEQKAAKVQEAAVKSKKAATEVALLQMPN